MRKVITYTCKDCNWQAEIIVQWADLKPSRCMNKKCNASFLKHPDKLDVSMPVEEPIVVLKVEQSGVKSGRVSKQ
jgi:hypothetical protein